MENKFEMILFKYGAKVLVDVRNLAECMEWYEDCAEINKILRKHNIQTDFNTEDWIAEIWRLGYSGKNAFMNHANYFYDAITSIYGDRIDEIIAPYKHIKISRI